MEIVVVIGWLKLLTVLFGFLAAILTFCRHLRNLLHPIYEKIKEAHLISTDNSKKIDELSSKFDAFLKDQDYRLDKLGERVAAAEAKLNMR